ncbi:MAG: hypothetical protein JW966_02655 [Anaerolineae bacterium]|nr:hypothetical protein [Anaerolineae bacterium]
MRKALMVITAFVVLLSFALLPSSITAQSPGIPEPVVVGPWELTVVYTHLVDQLTSGFYPNQTTFTPNPGHIFLEIMIKVRLVDSSQTTTLKNTDLDMMVVDVRGTEWPLIGTGMGFNNYCMLGGCESEYYFTDYPTGYVEYVFAVSTDTDNSNYTLKIDPDMSLPFTVPYVASFDDQLTMERAAPIPLADQKPITVENAGALAMLVDRSVFNYNLSALSFSADNTQLVTVGCDLFVKDECADGIVRSWTIETGQLATVINLNGTLSTAYPPLDLSTNASHLAGVDPNSEVHLWDIHTGEALAATVTPEGSVGSLALSPDGLLLATCDWDRLLKVWDVNTGQLVADLPGPCTSGIFSPDGKLLATYGGAPGPYGDGMIYLWDIATWQATGTVINPNSEVGQSNFVFNPDGTLLASGYPSNYQGDGIVHLWNVNDGTERAAWRQSETSVAVLGLAFSPDGMLLASSEENGVVHLWNVNTVEEVAVLGQPGTPAVTRMVFNAAGTLLALGRDDATAQLWGMPVTN